MTTERYARDRLEKERRALEAINHLIVAVGYPPTLRELGSYLGEGWSKSKCSAVLQRLADKGFLELGGAGNARAIKVLRPASELPLELGEVPVLEADE